MGAKRTKGTISNDRRKKRKNKNTVSTSTVAHPNWSGLHQDLIRCFAEQIVSVKEFFAFRGVNKSWRSEATKESSNAALRLQHKVPVLLVSEDINAPSSIYSLTKGRTYQLDLPETLGKFCYSSSGWLLTVTKDFSKLDLFNSKLDLFNPLTHAHIELPSLSFSEFDPDTLNKFVLSSSPSWTSNYEVLLLSNQRLAIYRPGYNNGSWTVVSRMEGPILMDAVYYKGQLYVVEYPGRIFLCEIQDHPNDAKWRLVAPLIPTELLDAGAPPYLVESAKGALLLVIFLYESHRELSKECRVFEMPFDNGKSWTESQLKNLGNTTLFLGANSSSFSIEALGDDDDSICKRNCIYLLNRCNHSWTRGEIDNGIYSMEDGKIDRHLQTLPGFKYKDSSITSHYWIQPSF